MQNYFDQFDDAKSDQIVKQVDPYKAKADARASTSADLTNQIAEINIREKNAKFAADSKEREKLSGANAATIATLKNTIAEFDQIKLDTEGDSFETGTGGNIARSLPFVANDAKGLEARLVGLKAQNAFAALQSLAAQGVKLTPISNAEIDLAAASVANLDPTQNQEIFLGQLAKARGYYQDSLERLEGKQAVTDTPPPPPQQRGRAGENVELNANIPDSPLDGLDRLSDEDEQAFIAFAPNAPSPEALIGFMAAKGKDVTPESAQKIFEFYKGGGTGESGIDYSKEEQSRLEQLQARSGVIDEVSGEAGLSELKNQGITLGASDEIAGLGGAIGSALRLENPIQGYKDQRDTERFRIEQAREREGLLGTATEIGSSLLIPGLGARGALGTGARAAIKTGAKVGATSGAIGGFNYGEGVQGSASGALIGAGAGGLAGGALVGAGKAVSALTKPTVNAFRRAAGKDPNVAINQVRNALTADGNTARTAGDKIAKAQSRGVPMALADTGENARQVAASVARQRGPARSLTVAKIGERQAEQMERISAAVRRDLGPTANIRELGDEIIKKARAESKPFYDKFEANPGAGALANKLENLFARPSMQKALKNAYKNALEEGVDPNTVGFDLDAAGEVLITETPSWKTLDAVKRGLDDVIEKKRNDFGKLDLKTGADRAAEATRVRFRAAMKKANPDYAEALDAYSGNASMKRALEKGAKALNKSPDDINSMLKNMSAVDKEMYRTGVRKAIVDMIGTKGDFGDKVNNLIGTPKSRAVLTRVFGGKRGYDNFIKSLREERELGLTYKAVSGNSDTALRMNFDETTNAEGLAAAAAQTVGAAKRSGIGGAIGDILQRVGEAGKLGAGKAGDTARESIAALLSETDPAELKLLIAAVDRAAAKQRLLKRKSVKRGGSIGGGVGKVGAFNTKDTRP